MKAASRVNDPYMLRAGSSSAAVTRVGAYEVDQFTGDRTQTGRDHHVDRQGQGAGPDDARRVPDRQYGHPGEYADQRHGLARVHLGRPAGRSHQDDRLAGLEVLHEIGRAAHLQRDYRDQAGFGVGSRVMQAIFLPAMAISASATIRPMRSGSRSWDWMRSITRVPSFSSSFPIGHVRTTPLAVGGLK